MFVNCLQSVCSSKKQKVGNIKITAIEDLYSYSREREFKITITELR